MRITKFLAGGLLAAGIAVLGSAAFAPRASADIEATVTENGYCTIPAIVESEFEPEVLNFRYNERLISGIIPEKAAPEEVKLYTERELEMLACVIYQEAGGDEATDETRRMVGEVVLNRVNDPRFPDSIEAVLTQKSQYGRMHWTGIVWAARASNPNEAYAVERAYRCAKMVFEEERLLPEDTVFQAGFVQGKEIVATAPGFYFCR